MAKPIKGSNIGSVTPFIINSGNGIMSKRPDFTENLQNIISNGAPNITSGIGTNINVTPQGSAIGLSEVPSTGLPNLTLDSVSELMQPQKGLGQSILDALVSSKAQTEFGDLIDTIVSPNELQLQEMERRRQSKVKSDLMIGDDDSVAGGIDDAILASSIKTRADFPRREAGIFEKDITSNNIETEDQNNSTDTQVVSGSGVSPTAAGESTGKSTNVPGADTPAKKAAVTALDEYLKAARPGVDPKDYSEYIREFGEATGLDVSGEPDNKTALMAFGLALMQNKAGKGFDVGEMLSAVGGAGEKAMPALEKARANAKAIRAKAGEYALGRKKEDQAAAMKREQFYVIPKGKLGGPLGVVDAITKGKGEFADLNSYELNNLNTNEEFNSQYEIVKASDYSELVKEALKTPEVKDLYQTGSTTIALFDGAPKDIGLMVQLPDLNNPKARGMVPGIQGGAAESIQYVRDMEKDLGKQKEFFGGIAGLLNRTGTGAVEQTRSAIVQGLRNLGLDTGGETDPIKQIQVMLTELKAKNAAQILGESGKTLSDNDRRMVAEIVGGISFTDGDEALLVQKLGRLYDAVVGKAEQNLNQAYRTLDSYGVKYGNSKRNEGVRKGKDDQGEYIDLTTPQ